MIRKGLIVTMFVAGLLLLGSGHTIATELNVSGNGAGSNNSVQIQNSQSTTVQQSNNASVHNDINATANTGGNSVSGGNGGTIKTGNASVDVNVNNQLNTNNATVTCCPGKTPTPTSKPGQPTPTPTTPGGTGGPGGDGGSSGGNGGSGGGSSSSGGVGGGQVQGLSATAGKDTVEQAITLSGIICLVSGTLLLRKNYFHA